MGGAEVQTLAFGEQEFFVEAGVVGGEGVCADKRDQRGDNFVGGRGGVNHLLGDAGEFGDKGRYPDLAVHQRYKAFHNLAVDNAQRGDFGDACALIRAHSRGFEVEHYDGLFDQGRPCFIKPSAGKAEGNPKCWICVNLCLLRLEQAFCQQPALRPQHFDCGHATGHHGADDPAGKDVLPGEIKAGQAGLGL